MHNQDTIAAALSDVWTDVVGEPFPVDDAEVRAGSLWSVGLTSATFIRLLTALEDRFGLEWDLDDSVSSFDELVVCVAARARRVPATVQASGR